MQEVYLVFFRGALPKLIYLNLLLQQSDTIIHLIRHSLFEKVIS